jgi:hypothetical protein
MKRKKSWTWRNKVEKEDLIIAHLDRLEAKVDLCIKDIAGLKVKAGVWGALAGIVPVVLGLAMWVITLK